MKEPKWVTETQTYTYGSCLRAVQLNRWLALDLKQKPVEENKIKIEIIRPDKHSNGTIISYYFIDKNFILRKIGDKFHLSINPVYLVGKLINENLSYNDKIQINITYPVS